MNKYLKCNDFENGICLLISDIRDGRINSLNVIKTIKTIENKYPNRFINIAIQKKNKPWSYETLKNYRKEISITLERKNDIIHMSEIADEVYRPKKIKNRITILTAIAIVIAIIAFIVQLRKWDEYYAIILKVKENR